MSRLPFSWNRRRLCCCAREEPSSPRSRGVSTQVTQITLGDMRRSISNVAFCSAGTMSPPRNGSLLATIVGGGRSLFGLGGQKKQPSPNSCYSLAPDVRAANSSDPMRKSSLASNATEVDHVEPKSPLESPSKYRSAFFTSQHQSLVSPGKSKYCALATVGSV